MNKPVGIPLKAWITVWMKEEQLNNVYYDARDIDPYIEALEKENIILRRICGKQHSELEARIIRLEEMEK